jgi:mannitol-specific phosphotransferase system IIBC component
MSKISGSEVKRLIIACEAGMGSSVMVAGQVRKALKGHDVVVSHSPVNQLADEAPDVVLCQSSLAGRAKQAVPNVPVIAFDMFLGDPKITGVISAVIAGTEISDE